MPAPALLWFRQDLRLADHAALYAAMSGGRPVLPVYILDDAAPGAWKPGGASSWWLHHSLAALSRDLHAAGAPLVLRRGDTIAQLADLAQETGATDIFCGGAIEPWARDLERNAHAALATQGVTLRRYRTATLLDPDTIRTQAGGAYGVYTPFSKACLAAGPKPPMPAPARIPSPTPPPSDILEDWHLLPTKPDWAGGLRATWRPGRAGAVAALATFLDTALANYRDRRDFPAEPATSRLSPHLHFGEISPAEAWHAAAAHPDAHGGAEKFLQELLWREFSQYLLWHHPTLPEAPLRPEFARMPWRDAPTDLAAWQRGQTGIPIVDAGMRELWHTGWMHNRVRMIVASFLVKHLLLPWRAGEDWFWDTLVDADLAANAASWQWVAGSGADAAPYFRIFNPVLQSQKFDPDGTYIRRHVPELTRLATPHIHAPWEAPPAILAQAGITLDQTYPTPITNLPAARTRALAAYASLSPKA